MEKIRKRITYLFTSTKGLALTGIAVISLVAGFFGMLSGPMAELGVGDWIAKTFGMVLLPEQREGRIVILYHTIANAVIAVEVYFITGIYKDKMKAYFRTGNQYGAHRRLPDRSDIWFGVCLLWP